MQSLFEAEKKYLIITDKEDEIKLMQLFAKDIFARDLHSIKSISDFWYMTESASGIWCMHSRLLELTGNLHHLQQHSRYDIARLAHVPIEMVIERLIDFGYSHSSYPGELGSYRREWSILTLTDAQSSNLIHIEWFDTEIDSIVEIDAQSGERSFREKISIKTLQAGDIQDERHIGTLNTELLNTAVHTAYPPAIIVIGGDFLSYIDTLRSVASIHYTDFHRDDALSLGIEIPTINHIDALLWVLRDTQYECVRIYTKLEMTLREFLEFHTLSRVELIGVKKVWLQSAIRGSEIILCDDILGEIFVRKRSKKSIAKHLDLLISLSPGDLVVHREHGIARFAAVTKKSIQNQYGGSTDREYMELHYADGDKLFVPLTEIYRVSRYLGKPDVEVTKLTGKEWERTIEKTNEEIEAIAQDILETSARRSLTERRPFAKFRDKEIEFRDAFQYDHTSDQLGAIEDIFTDMEANVPMDRLVSGDVGFGKTEVAMNAIYKAVLSGYQVAVISPLLVLADEHCETFTERLSPFWVRVAVMTRMNTVRESEDTIQALKSGTIDVVVGTHRLLSDDIKFRKLGLLVIDEEHKFGVSHKEKIKKIRAGIDILSLSATPIPRSLNLALSGLKKISVLATPPRKKKSIETIITRWNESILSTAIQTERGRWGQVIILHNRIRGMEGIEKEFSSLIGDMRMVMTHGQMPGDQIEDRIHAFKRREYDILLTTTIIENGVNFLSANTIIIIDPEEFGLASLHQLRGRVGRKDEQWYCYLMYRKPELSKDEKERLITIANNSHLGAGFEIAMRDMEIRGAGDVLGIKQSGKSKDIGLTLYFRLLEERIEELKNIRKKRVLPKVELDISYSIPDTEFLSEADKLGFFREMENIESAEELDEIERDMKSDDISMANLFLILRARLILSEYGVIKLSKVGINYVFDFGDDVTVDDVRRFLDRFDSVKRMILLSMKKIRVETRYYRDPIEFLRELSY